MSPRGRLLMKLCYDLDQDPERARFTTSARLLSTACWRGGSRFSVGGRRNAAAAPPNRSSIRVRRVARPDQPSPPTYPDGLGELRATLLKSRSGGYAKGSRSIGVPDDSDTRPADPQPAQPRLRLRLGLLV